MNLININQFDVTTLSGIKAKLAAGILNARIVADNETYPKDWRERAVKTLELAKRHALTAKEPFRYQDGLVLAVVDGQECFIEFIEGEYRVRVQ